MPSSGSYIRQSEASVNEKVKERRSGWGRQAKFFSGAGRTLLDGVIPAGRRRRPGGQSVRRGIPLRGGRRRRTGGGFIVGVRAMDEAGDADFGKAGFQRFGDGGVGTGPDYGGGVFGIKRATGTWAANIIGVFVGFGIESGIEKAFRRKRGSGEAIGVEGIGENGIENGLRFGEIGGRNPNFQIAVLGGEHQAGIEILFVVRDFGVFESRGERGENASAGAAPEEHRMVESSLWNGRSMVEFRLRRKRIDEIRVALVAMREAAAKFVFADRTEHPGNFTTRRDEAARRNLRMGTSFAD